jgi:hypothetical protein
VTLRGDAVARGTRVMAAGKGAVSQRKSEGELCTRVGDMTSALGTSTAGGNTVTLPVTTCVDGLFRTVGTATGSGHVAEPTGGECERDSGDCCRLGTDTILCGEHVTDPPEGEGAGSQATTVLGDPLGRVPKEIAGDMVPEVGCGMFRNFPLPQGEGGIEFTGDRTFSGVAHGAHCSTEASRVAAEAAESTSTSYGEAGEVSGIKPALLSLLLLVCGWCCCRHRSCKCSSPGDVSSSVVALKLDTLR